MTANTASTQADFAKNNTVTVIKWWMDGREAVPENVDIVLVTKKTNGEWIGELSGRQKRTVTVPTPTEKYVRKCF